MAHDTPETPVPDLVNLRRTPRRNPETVGALVTARQCSTGPSFRLNAQIAAEVNCIKPGAFAYIDDIPNVKLNHGANPLLQASAAEALRRVAATAPHAWLPVNSTWRSAVQQYILKRWEGSCGIGLAAPVGQSNHESGLAVDVPLTTLYGFHAELADAGWRWFCAATHHSELHGCRDVPHHDYRRGTDLRRQGVKAFQRLWNHAHPDDRIAVTGRFDRATSLRMEQAPLAGFDTGTTCGLAFATWRCPPLFHDVSPRHPQRYAMEAVAQAEVWDGCGQDRFCPDGGLTRAEWAEVLGRALGVEEGRVETAVFDDVPAGHPQAGWIAAVAEAGVVSGCRPLNGSTEEAEAVLFCPQAPVTRSQVAVWVSRALNVSQQPPDGALFEDVGSDYWAVAEVEAVARAGLALPGCREGRFCPAWLPSRAQVAALVVDAFAIPVGSSCPRSTLQASWSR
ncbi:MAG: hypothetical protein AAFX99_23250 [Myxococcota bacterium]